MEKTELIEKTDALIEVTRDSLQLLWDKVNKGQKKQILKNEQIKAMFDRYGVDYES